MDSNSDAFNIDNCLGSNELKRWILWLGKESKLRKLSNASH